MLVCVWALLCALVSVSCTVCAVYSQSALPDGTYYLLDWPRFIFFFTVPTSHPWTHTHTHTRTHTQTDCSGLCCTKSDGWLIFPTSFCPQKNLHKLHTQTHTYACLPPCTICFSVTKLKRDFQGPEMFRGITPSSLFLRLYAVGGRDGSSCLRSVECFDPHTNRSETGDFICQQLIAVSYFVSCLHVPLVKRFFLLGYLPTDQKRLVTLTGC